MLHPPHHDQDVPQSPPAGPVDSTTARIATSTDTINPGRFTTQTSPPEIFGVDLTIVMQQGAKAVTIVVLAWFAIRLLKSFTGRLLVKIRPEPGTSVTAAEQRSRTLVQLLNSTASIVIAVIAGLSILNLFVDIGPLIAGIGVLGLAVSFGAQSLVKDIISGFFILLENQYDVGDIVEINGVAGEVEAMTLRTVTIRDINGVVHIIPNGSIAAVSNKTAEWSRLILDVGVAYRENVDRVISVLNSLCDEMWKDADWKGKLNSEPTVWGVNDLSDSAVVIRLAMATRPGQQWVVKRELLRRIKNRFDAEDIEIPFPQRTVHLRERTDA